MTLLAFKRLDALRNHCSATGLVSPNAGGQMRHSQSTVAVAGMRTLSSSSSHGVPLSMLNSESMPDLTVRGTASSAPPPLPPRARFASDTVDVNFDGLFVSDPVPPVPARKAVSESCSCVRTQRLRASDLGRCRPGAKHRRSTSSCQVAFEACCRPSSLFSGIKDDRRDSLEEVFLCTTAASSKSTSGYESADTSSEVVQSAPSANKPPAVSPGGNGNSAVPPLPPPEFRDDPKEMKEQDEAAEEQNEASKECDEAAAVDSKPNSDGPCKTEETDVAPEPTPTSKLGKSSNGILPSLKNRSPLLKNSTPQNEPTMPCEGTVFFPKPPAQFAGEQSTPVSSGDTNPENGGDEEGEEGDNPDLLLNGIEKEVCLDPTAGDARRRYEERKSYLETKCTILEMLTDLGEGDKDGCLGRSPKKGPERCRPHSEYLRDEDTTEDKFEDGISVRRQSAVNVDVVRWVGL